MSTRKGKGKLGEGRLRGQRPRNGGVDPHVVQTAEDGLMLSGAMLDLLARDGRSARGVEKGDGSDFGLKERVRPVDPHWEIDPDVAAAAVLLGYALAGKPGLFDRIMGEAPVVIVECDSDGWVDPATTALRRCFAVRSSTGDASSSSLPGAHLESGSVVVVTASAGPWAERRGEIGPTTRAYRSHRPLVGVVSRSRDNLPVDLVDGCETRLRIGCLDPTMLALVVARIVGSPCRTTIEFRIAEAVEPIDLRIAVHPARGADGSLVRLTEVVRSKLRKTASCGTGPRLSDLQGYGAAAVWGLAVAADLKAYLQGEIPWREVDPGALLTGPPGTGKTTFASALAREAGVPLIAGSLAQWQSSGEAHLGTTLKAMRSFFQSAIHKAPCVAIVDELDSFGDRVRFSHRHSDYSIQIVNGFLECLDGQGGREGVLLVGTTNIPQRIDPAILRSGRFDRVIAIDLPTLRELDGIIRYHLGADLPDADLTAIARRGNGGTGADCAAWVRRARGRARREGRPVAVADLFDEVSAAVQELDPSDEWRIAVHEAGHAVVAHSFGLSMGDLSLRSLANCGSGLASVHPSPLPTSQSLRNMLAVLLAGRAAEVVVCGAPSAGAKTDLAIATSLAHDMNFRWGLGRLLAVQDHPAGSSFDAVERELRSASRIACGIVNERLVALERLATELLGMRFLTAREVGRSLEAASAAGEEVVPEGTIASELPPRESAVRAVPDRRG